jgi:short-subunit dehydrogenase
MMGNTKKIIWVIGAGSGIGRALAINLSREGHRVILSGRHVERLESVQADCINATEIIPLDVMKPDEILAAYKNIKENIGKIDSVICMSAIYHPMEIDNLNLEICQNILATNLMPAFTILHTVIPDMKSHGQGQIVFCGSVAGYRGLPHAQPYSATKAALINLAQSARLDLWPFGIDVKIINPGFVKTEMTDKNSFSMPMMITAEQAANKIVAQMKNPNRFEIRTHGIFSWIMKTIRVLPDYVYFKVMRR